MTTINLYRADKSVGPNETEGSVLCGHRLIAEDGYLLTDGETTAPCVDVLDGTEDKWTETAAPEEEWTDEELAEAGRILMGFKSPEEAAAEEAGE